ncbi:MAG: VWA domain-containing protein, partial [Gemmatimonadota bacterium]|nr:VWA domain-containing protein [Gemmatimonadota bacterium]
MQFDAPWFLIVAPVVAILFALLAWGGRRARLARARRWSQELGARARRENRLTWFVIALAAAAATVALAGPRWGRRVVESTLPALDLVIAVDLSRSMLAEDVAPSRLGRAQQQVRRMLHDLAGDRVGLIGFAGRSFILAPLTADASALHLLVDALHPDQLSAGGTDLGAALRQGRELLLASDRVADRVLVMFTDGEAHDSLAAAVAEADRLRRDGVRLVLVAEGSDTPTRIPIRDAAGTLVGYHTDEDGGEVQTSRRDDVLTAVADAGEGVFVAAGLEDQSGAVRDLVVGFKRAPVRTATTRHELPRAWVPILGALGVLLLHAFTRRTAALVGLALVTLTAGAASAQAPANVADAAWRAGRFGDAARLYLEQARRGVGGDTAWFNAGTALLALAPDAQTRDVLARAARTLDPEIRFRAVYNLGLLALRLADQDSAGRAGHLAEARTRYREALLLKPGHAGAKWNLELAM